ncbi:MAG: DUF4340 domain-containing protein [Gammaproteobacteria bacterium]|nr:DUF4340 domain-containing protein [Gammaproteobacteria bacterium]
MKTRLWLNLALAIIVAILVALVYFKPGHKRPAPAATLTRLQAPDVREIRIAQPDTATVELVRANGAWRMTAPANLPADQYLVKSLLDSLSAEIKSSFSAAPAKLAQYGLDPARVRLWINGTEFDFGDTEPLNNYRYVLSGGQVHVVSGMLFYRLAHRPYWWVSKRLLPAQAQITALQLPDATVTLAGGKWQLAPADSAVSSDAIQTLVDNWQDAQAIGVEKAQAGKPAGEVAIELAGEKSALRFAILQDPNFFVLARPDLGIAYQLPADQRAALLNFKSSHAAPKAASKTRPTRPDVHN